MKALCHPQLGHVILRPDECRIFVEYVQEMDDTPLASTFRDWRWLAETRAPDPEAEWRRDRCYEEIERREKLRYGRTEGSDC
jgi:hypothetical protein